jgi:transcriptional regulator with XRE-family HTH domain
MTPHAVADWETGRHVPTLRSLRSIAAVLELSYDELVQLRWAAVEGRRRARERAAA